MRILRWLGVLSVILCVGLGGTAFWVYAQHLRPGPSPRDVIVVVPRGFGVEGIAKLLGAKGVIASPLLFTLIARTIAASRTLHAGEFVFPAKVTPQGAMNILQDGLNVVRRLTVAEGLSVAEILRQLAETEGLEGGISQIPEEGSLLPETYHFSYGDKRGELIRRMRRAMDQALRRGWHGDPREHDRDSPQRHPETQHFAHGSCSYHLPVQAESPPASGRGVPSGHSALRSLTPGTLTHRLSPAERRVWILVLIRPGQTTRTYLINTAGIRPPRHPGPRRGSSVTYAR